MKITIRASVIGGSGASSVLDLEPVLAFARQARPDAVALLPPNGADDLPNGGALLTIKERLAAEGIEVVGDRYQIPEGAPIQDDRWRAQAVFEARSLLLALGEAGVGPLVLGWGPAAEDGPSRSLLRDFLSEMADEADRAGIGVAVAAQLPTTEAVGLLKRLGSGALGLCYQSRTGASASAQELRALRGMLRVVQASRVADAAAEWSPLLEALRDTGFAGPLMIDGPETQITAAYAIGYARGLLGR